MHAEDACNLCRGQRRGAVKHGIGAYRYPSGASYDGEWVNNVKQGRGIFRFAKVVPLHGHSGQMTGQTLVRSAVQQCSHHHHK